MVNQKKVKFVDKNGKYVEELCHNPLTCRENKSKIVKSYKDLKDREENKNIFTNPFEENVKMQSLDELMSTFEDEDCGDDEKLISKDSNIPNLVVCKSKYGIGNCKYHTELSQVEKQIEECYEKIER